MPAHRSPRRATAWRTLIATAAAAALFGLAACSAAPSDATGSDGVGEPAYGGTLVVGQYQEVTVLDPSRQYSWETYRLDKHIYESLVKEDLTTPSTETPEVLPALAESWEIENDARLYRFKLREGVTFHDGTPFNADAVVFNVRRGWDPDFEYYDEQAAGLSAVFGDLKDVRAVDEYTVEYEFNNPFVGFLRLLAQGNFVQGIFSPTAVETYGLDGLQEHPTGTGPFSFVERVRGDHVTLEANEDYWDGRPYLDRVIFRPITDDAARLAALQAGEIDILTHTDTDTIDGLLADGYDVPTSTNAGELYYSFHYQNEYIADPAVRKAIVQAVDRQAIADELYSGYAQPVTSIVNPGSLAYDPDAVDAEYDPEAAKKTLADAGYDDGEVKFTIVADVANQPNAEYIQRYLAAVGIDATVEAYDWLSYNTVLTSGDPQIGLGAMEWGFLEPAGLAVSLYPFHIYTEGGGEGIVDPRAQELLDEARYAATVEEAVEKTQEADEVIRADFQFLPLINFTNYWATSPRVQDFVVPAQNFYDLTRVWLAD